MDAFGKDIRYALRQLRNAPGFAGTAILIMALGIGANTAIFSVVNAVLLRPPPYEQIDRLVEIYTDDGNGNPVTSSYPDYRDIQAERALFARVATHRLSILTYSDGSASTPFFVEYVSGNYFETLGLGAHRGRPIGPEDDVRGGAPVGMISASMWRREFAEDPAVIGRTITLNGRAVTIIGVGPPDYSGSMAALSVDVWLPVSSGALFEPARGSNLENRGRHDLWIKARLAPGVTPERARAGLDVLHERLAASYPETNTDRPFTLIPSADVHIHPVVDRALVPVAVLLMTVVGLVLVIATTNLANLLSVRGAGRQKEIAVRIAIGAGRNRLLRQLLTESTVLALVGGGLGVLLASTATRLLVAFQPPLPVPLALDFGIDWRVMLFTLILSVATGILFGLMPALRVSRPNILPMLKNEAIGLRAGGRRFTLQNGLVIAQVAVSLMLLIGAGLFVRSLVATQRIDPGFEQRQVAMSMVMMPEGIEPQPYIDRLTERLQALPGVTFVAMADRLPLGAGIQTRGVTIPEYTLPPGMDELELDFATVSHDYFEVMSIPMLQGRAFLESDGPEAPRVAIVSAAAADRYWPRGEVVGREFRLGGIGGDPVTVIGVARDTKVRTPSEAPRPYMYLPSTQNAMELPTIALRTEGSPTQLAERLRRELTAFDPDLPVFEVKTMAEHLSVMLFPPRAAAALLSAFGLLALVLASLGVHGVVAFAVAQRTREMGIRIALGATGGSIVGSVLRHAFMLVTAGVVTGAGIAFVITKPLGRFLVGVETADPMTFLGVSGMLMLIAAAASVLPAIRATRLDPVRALRAE